VDATVVVAIITTIGAVLVAVVGGFVKLILDGRTARREAAKRADDTAKALAEMSEAVKGMRETLDDLNTTTPKRFSLLFRDKLQYIHHLYCIKGDGTMPREVHQMVQEINKEYHACGGNGTAAKMMRDIDALDMTD
jgi:hypothetical protein